MGNDALKQVVVEAASKPGATLDDVVKAAAGQVAAEKLGDELAEKLGDKGAAAAAAAAQPASSVEQLAANIATALVVANNPELTLVAPFIAAQVENVLSREKRRAALSWFGKLMPWNW